MVGGESGEYEVLRSLWITGTVSKDSVTDSVSISMMHGSRRQLSSSLLLCGSMQIRIFTLAVKAGVVHGPKRR